MEQPNAWAMSFVIVLPATGMDRLYIFAPSMRMRFVVLEPMSKTTLHPLNPG